MDNSKLLGLNLLSYKKDINFHVFGMTLKNWIGCNRNCTLSITKNNMSGE